MTPPVRGASQPELRLVDGLLARSSWLLVSLSVLMVLASARRITIDNDWQFFNWGGDLLFGQHLPFTRSSYTVDPSLPGGLHVYASYPFLQIGPPALVLAKTLSALGPHGGADAAAVLIQGLGLLALWFPLRGFPAATRGRRIGALVGASLVVVVWGQLTYYHHLDDALALSSISGAVLALRRDRALLGGLLLGLAAASKPWAVVGLALVLLESTTRGRIRCMTAAVCVAAGCWAPFVLADSKTLQVGRVDLSSVPGGPLSAIGVGVVTHSSSLRLVQLALGTLLAVLLVLRARWPLALLAAFSLRLAIDPASYGYYACGLVFAAFLADSAVQRVVPTLTLVAAGGWAVAAELDPSAAAAVRLTDYFALLTMCLVALARSSPQAVSHRPGLGATAAVPSAHLAHPTRDPPGGG